MALQQVTRGEARTYPCVEIYMDSAGQWRWRLFSRNKRIVAESGEGYFDRRGVNRAVKSTFALVRKHG